MRSFVACLKTLLFTEIRRLYEVGIFGDNKLQNLIALQPKWGLGASIVEVYKSHRVKKRNTPGSTPVKE
jgi:hypothetical protein